MSNTYFQFKQFTIHQDNCAMKVCTDACLFGAVVADKISRGYTRVANLLDIGAGTGLLSLQVAQKTAAAIEAVEMEAAAFHQATKNFIDSPWRERLEISHKNVLDFFSEKKYDCIISNPPFFEGDLKSENSDNNSAKHDTALTLKQLLRVIEQHLSPQGFFGVLLPYHRVDYFITMAAASNYCLQEQLLVKHTESHPFFRGILFFTQVPNQAVARELSIKDSAGDYTREFKDLLKDYYLHI